MVPIVRDRPQTRGSTFWTIISLQEVYVKHSQVNSGKDKSPSPSIVPSAATKSPKKVKPELQEFADRLTTSVVKGLRSLK